MVNQIVAIARGAGAGCDSSRWFFFFSRLRAVFAFAALFFLEMPIYEHDADDRCYSTK
jgi:hypothetical protein